MKNKILLWVIVIFLIGCSITYADSYKKLCLTYGQKALTPPQSYTCHKDCCKLCVVYIGTGTYATNPNICNALGLDCACGQSSQDFDAPQITINFPYDNYASPERYITFDLSMDEVSDLYYLDSQEENKGYRKICSVCNKYHRAVSFDEGYHNLTFKARDRNGNSGYKSVAFYIDSREPKIRDITPDDGGYANGLFTIDYDEENLQRIILHYKQSGSYVDVTKTDCPAGKAQECIFNIAGLEQGPLEFYFTLGDLATTVDSKVYEVTVDTVSPVITLTEPQNMPYPERKIQFGIALSENVRTLEYLDYNDQRPKYQRLCSNCGEYQKTRPFNDGEHNLSIRATDFAGNEGFYEIVFAIDSKDPRIKKQEPKQKSYDNGVFKVEYDEENLQSVTLHYNQGSGYVDVTKTDCPAGKKQECYFVLTNLEQGYLEYYFTLTDLIRDVDGKVYKDITIDSIPPGITINSPAYGSILNSRYVGFDILLSEEVKTLEYMDNNDSRPKFSRFCSRCSKYNMRKSFSYGEHNLLIKAEDYAGNEAFTEIIFTIQ